MESLRGHSRFIPTSEPRFHTLSPAGHLRVTLLRSAAPSLPRSSAGFQNEGDNEITGIHVSDGDPGPNGILGARSPHPFKAGHAGTNRWRAFYTQQHGDNPTYELIAAPRG